MPFSKEEKIQVRKQPRKPVIASLEPIQHQNIVCLVDVRYRRMCVNTHISYSDHENCMSFTITGNDNYIKKDGGGSAGNLNSAAA